MSQSRKDIHFSEAARNALAFLAKDYCFSVVTVSDRRVRYESDTVFIEMLYGLRDCEIYIEFGRLKKQESYSFTLFLRLVNPDLEKCMGDRMANSPETIAATVNALVKALRSEGQGIIEGDCDIFERMKDVRWWDFCPEALR